jgi:hypothetical protein
MRIRYYSPRKEGKRLKYYHVSKHGGTWVQHVFRQTFKNDDSNKGFEIEDADCVTATVFRHPFNFYKSLHAFYLLNGERIFISKIWNKDCWRDELNEFVESLFLSKRQFLTERYTPLIQCNLLGTTENLRKDLERFLDTVGYEYDKEILKLPAVRVASALPEYTQELNPKSKALIEQFEGEAIQMWEEVHAKSQT